jgi:hypothetical protein
MPRNETLNYLTARDLWNEIRQEAGWDAKHGFQDGKIGVWLSRTTAPAITPVFLTTRDQWLWLRDMLDERTSDGSPGQVPMPLDESNSTSSLTSPTAGAPTLAKRLADAQLRADSQRGGAGQ